MTHFIVSMPLNVIRIGSYDKKTGELYLLVRFKKDLVENGTMECLPEDKLLKYNPDTLVALRKLYNLDKPGQIDEAVDLLDNWVKKQNHFVKKNYSREYLERVIILLKGSVERAKSQMDKICTLRTLLPHFFDKVDIKHDFKDIFSFQHTVLLPVLTKDHSRIYVSKFESMRYTPGILLQIYIYYILICEYLKAHDYSNGLIAIVDLRNVNIMDLVVQINLSELRQMATISLEGYDTRARNFFFISASRTIDVVVKIFKQVISEKLGKRIHMIKEVEELYEHIPKELLPSDYGGDQKSIATLNAEHIEVFGSEENIKYLRVMSQARTIESMRTSTKYNEDFLGIAGTFRTLNVD